MTIPHCEHNRPDFNQIFAEGKAGDIKSPEALHTGKHQGPRCDLICGSHTTDNDGQKNIKNQLKNDFRVIKIEEDKKSLALDSDEEYIPKITKQMSSK